MENFLHKMGLMGCKWSSLTAPGIETTLSHSVLELEEFPFPLLAFWANKNWLPSMKVEKLAHFLN